MGDINDDGLVNILDIIEVLTLIFNENIEFIVTADLNYDNKIDIFDLIHTIELN